MYCNAQFSAEEYTWKFISIENSVRVQYKQDERSDELNLWKRNCDMEIQQTCYLVLNLLSQTRDLIWSRCPSHIEDTYWETPHGVISVVGLRAPADVITRFNSVLPRFSYFSSRDFETLKKCLQNASLDLGGGEDLPFPTSVRDQRFPIKNSVTFITTGQCQVTTGARNNILFPFRVLLRLKEMKTLSGSWKIEDLRN